MNQQEAFRLLRQRGASKAVVVFSGGNDEGGVDGITLFVGDEEVSLEPYAGDGYQHVGGRFVPTSQPANDDERLADLLAAPVESEYGSFAGEFEVYGTVTWDVASGTVKMAKDESSYEHSEYDY